MTETEMLAAAESRFFVANAMDRFGREYNLWAVWYRDNHGNLKQTGDEPFLMHWNAQRRANRYNRVLDALQSPLNKSRNPNASVM